VVEKRKRRHHPAGFYNRKTAPAGKRGPEDDAMDRDSRKRVVEGSQRFDADTIEREIRERIRATIEVIVEEELEATLGAKPSQRAGGARQGYRHGHRERRLTSSVGATTIAMPRARMTAADGRSSEWHSRTVRRYERRTQRVDEALLGVYLSGANSRRIRGALAPLLRGGPLGKDAVSRLVGRLKSDFESWRERDLEREDIRYVFLDGWYPKLRLGNQRVRVPVLVVLGVRADGQRVVLDLRLVGDESAAAWQTLITKLVARHLAMPALAVIDGNPGLAAALREAWPGIRIQRCTAHKLRNLEAKAPRGLREELREDYRRMIYADTPEAIATARKSFRQKWQQRCPGVVESLDEAGDELFTFSAFPPSQWKALRTTNALERINEEFRRRTKTQASLPGQDAVLLLLFGLLRSGAIRLRRIDGWQDMAPAARLTARVRQARRVTRIAIDGTSSTATKQRKAA
jgi:putative transposase